MAQYKNCDRCGDYYDANESQEYNICDRCFELDFSDYQINNAEYLMSINDELGRGDDE